MPEFVNDDVGWFFGKHILRNFLIAVVIIFVMLLLYVTSRNYGNGSNYSQPQNNTTQNSSVFDNLRVDIQTELLEDMGEFFVGGSTDYWKDWDYRDKVIFAHIQEVNEVDNDVVVDISPPVRERFSNIRWNLHIGCQNKYTIAVSDKSPLSNVIDYDFDVFDRIKAGDILIGFCLEEECINLGKKCYLVVK